MIAASGVSEYPQCFRDSLRGVYISTHAHSAIASGPKEHSSIVANDINKSGTVSAILEHDAQHQVATTAALKLVKSIAMVHYIRFLKPPMLGVKGSKATVRALITVTTDLGDNFYQAGITLFAILLEEEESLSQWRKYQWKAGMRTLWIEIGDIPIAAVWSSIRLLVTHKKSKDADSMSHENMPEILSAWSDRFGLADEPDSNVRHKVERRLGTAGSVISIYEECGESIARHIWDAGVALAAYFADIAKETSPDALQTAGGSNSMIHGILAASALQGFTVLELGSGCGIVGLQVARLYPKSSVLLTDLPEAMGILDYNLMRAQLAENSTLKKDLLNWYEELPEPVTKGHFDLILVSDCTYNSDTIPALVNTLAALAARSPHALIVVSMKARHESEESFFALISSAGFDQIDHSAILLPSRQMETVAQGAIETIDIYMYCKAQA